MLATTSIVAAAALDDVELAQRLKLDIWRRGIAECGAAGCSDDSSQDLGALKLRWLASRSTPFVTLRGGSDGCADTTCEPDASVDLDALRAELGPEFGAALDQNIVDHDADCAKSCEHFYCGSPGSSQGAPPAAVATRSFSMGSVPPEDFATSFLYPLDLIRVTAEPLIEPAEAEQVVATAIEEGISTNEYASGKYRLGGDWVSATSAAMCSAACTVCACGEHAVASLPWVAVAGIAPRGEGLTD